MGRPLPGITEEERKEMLYYGDLMYDPVTGDELITGMTREESEEFLSLRLKSHSHEWMTENERERYVSLTEKRERVRQPSLNAEFEAKRTGRSN